ncbi:MAG: hypothetical protein AAGJ94_12705, partial [Pseudomonadota bacterium]
LAPMMWNDQQAVLITLTPVPQQPVCDQPEAEQPDHASPSNRPDPFKQGADAAQFLLKDGGVAIVVAGHHATPQQSADDEAAAAFMRMLLVRLGLGCATGTLVLLTRQAGACAISLHPLPDGLLVEATQSARLLRAGLAAGYSMMAAEDGRLLIMPLMQPGAGASPAADRSARND